MIQVERVSKSFPTSYGIASWLRHGGRQPRREALRNVSLDVRRGELFGLVGPNGAGKTTLLKLVASLSIPDSGSITVNGIAAQCEPLAVRRQLGLCISEERSFYFRLSVRQNMEFFGVLAGLRGRELSRRIAAVVDMVDLGNTLESRFDSLSSGMRQRLSLARAMIADPPVLLVDEPTRGVDPMHAEALRRMLRDELVSRRGKTVLLTTNILEEAWSICDTIAILKRGAIVRSGAPHELESGFKKELRFLVGVDRLSGDLLDRLRGLAGVNRVEPADTREGPTLRIELLPSARGLTDLLRALSQNGTLVRNLTSESTRPFDVFVESEEDDDGG